VYSYKIKINLRKGDTYFKQFIFDDKIYQGFKDIFNDYNPLHTDADYAKRKGFKDKVMHGNILGGFLSFFIGECLPTKDVIIHSQEIKYVNPVYLNDILSLYVIIEDIFDSVKVIEFNFLFENQHQQKVAKGKINIGLL
jgi:3-hydroxybutyryl-CoA dehydratase